MLFEPKIANLLMYGVEVTHYSLKDGVGQVWRPAIDPWRGDVPFLDCIWFHSRAVRFLEGYG